MRSVLIGRAVAACAAAALAGLPAPAAAAPETEVTVRDFHFFPAYKVVFVGTTVNWHNCEDCSQHTVTAYPDAPAAFDSSPDQPDDDTDCSPPLPTDPPRDCLDAGETFSFTFSKAGTYGYYCKLHDNPNERPDPDAPAQEQPCVMCGIINVKVETTPSPRGPTRTTEPEETETASPTRTRSTSPTRDATGTPTSTRTGVAVGKRDGGGGGGGQVALAVVAILVLGGAAYATWRRYIARS